MIRRCGDNGYGTIWRQRTVGIGQNGSLSLMKYIEKKKIILCKEAKT